MTEIDPAYRYQGRNPWRRLSVWVTATCVTVLIRLWTLTWRCDWSARQEIEDRRAQGEAVALVFWHGNFLPLFGLLPGMSGLVIAATSFRGAVMGRVAMNFGFRCVQVGGGKGQGEAAMRAELARPGGLVGIAIDGPLGPLHQPKLRSVAVCMDTGATVFPIVGLVDRKTVNTRRWDGMVRPRFGARVTLGLGAPLRLDPAAPVEEGAGRIRAALMALETGSEV